MDGIEGDDSDCDDNEDKTYFATEDEGSDNESLVVSEEVIDVVVNVVSTN